MYSYNVNGVTGVTEINATKLCGNEKIQITLTPADSVSSIEFGDPIHIPTKYGFTNKPGCKETYTAIVNVKYLIGKDVVTTSHFKLSALEYGGTFQQHIFKNVHF